MPSNNHAPATKADLEALEGRLKQSLTESLTQSLTESLKQSLTESLKESLAAAVKELRDYIEERTHDVETRLLRAFGDYQQAQTTRFRHMKADLGNLNVATDERLAALEERVTNVEKRLIVKNI